MAVGATVTVRPVGLMLRSYSRRAHANSVHSAGDCGGATGLLPASGASGASPVAARKPDTGVGAVGVTGAAVAAVAGGSTRALAVGKAAGRALIDTGSMRRVTCSTACSTLTT